MDANSSCTHLPALVLQELVPLPGDLGDAPASFAAALDGSRQLYGLSSDRLWYGPSHTVRE